jgi:hypothetical protein
MYRLPEVLQKRIFFEYQGLSKCRWWIDIVTSLTHLRVNWNLNSINVRRVNPSYYSIDPIAATIYLTPNDYQFDERAAVTCLCYLWNIGVYGEHLTSDQVLEYSQVFSRYHGINSRYSLMIQVDHTMNLDLVLHVDGRQIEVLWSDFWNAVNILHLHARKLSIQTVSPGCFLFDENLEGIV